MKRLIVSALFATLATSAFASSAFAFEGQCTLEVGGKTWLSGPCNVEIDKDGSFTIGVSDRKPSKYFAYVNVDRPGVATGFWNGAEAESHAHEPLGELTRTGACWTNARARVCAKK